MNNRTELRLDLRDTEWPLNGIDHDRQIVRAIVVDGSGLYCFVRAVRDDEFGAATLIETSGGGVEPGEDLCEAIKRELREELGAEVEVLCKIGVVSDYYNLIRRHNVNHYFLCRARSFGERHLTRDEIEKYHLSTLRLSYDDAVAEYERRAVTPLGRLIANRELPVLKRAKELLEEQMRIWCFGDSNTYGYDPCGFFGGRYDRPWPELMAEHTGCRAINDGQNGRMIPRRDAEMRRFERDAARYRADALVVMLGTNDLLNGATAGETARRMEAFLTRCRISPILLVAPPSMRRGAWVPEDGLVGESVALNRAYRELAGRMNIPFADAGEWDVELAYDGVHFTEAGHAAFAKEISDAVSGLLNGAKNTADSCQASDGVV